MCRGLVAPPYDSVVIQCCTLLRNLMSNALAYTRRGGLLVSARQRGERVLFQI